MIAYEIQLRYVIRDEIRDKIQSDTKSSLRQFFFGQKKFFFQKQKLSQILSWTLSRISSALFLSCLGQINAYHH